jgi:diaminohydroxyphosphoribosylaminopyrimidine deaminase / 5-amino-6-(5-phosphoribosylamino)uracil reductase
LFLAPRIIGGEKAPGLVAGEGILHLKDAFPVKLCKVGRSGPDILIEADLKKV